MRRSACRLGRLHPLSIRVSLLFLALLTCLLALAGCRASAERTGPAAPPPDPAFSLDQPVVTPRAGAAGAPVDCQVSIANRSGRAANRVEVACELLDADGVPLGTGLSAVQNLAIGESRVVRAVVYGVRRFTSARAFVTAASFQ